MESSQICGVAEGCQSSESGWTMYLASPIQDDGGGDDDEHSDDGDSAAAAADDDDDGGDNKSYNDVDSDDSMASDASSGPSCQVMAMKQEEDKHVGKYQMEMKVINKPKESKRAERGRKEEKEAMAFMAKTANNASAQSSSKDAIMHGLKM